MTKELFRLHKRNGVYHIRFQRFGKRISRSLKTGNLPAAQSRAKKLVAAAELRHFDALDPAARRELASLAEIEKVYRAAAAARGIKAATVRDYVNSLKLVVNGAGFDYSGASSAVLTRDLVERFIRARLASAADPRARRTVKSTIRQAKAVFSRWALDEFRVLKLPDLSEFLAAGRLQAQPVQYEVPPAALVARTLKAGRALRKDDKALYACFLCCYDLALRASEAVALRWDWFRKSKGAVYLDLIPREGWKPKGRARTLPVAPDVWKHFAGIRTDGDFVLPGKNVTERTVLVKREFAAWMRQQGWNAGRWPKAAHELRKLQGSRWFTELGAEVAQAWLGHSDISTTCRYYAALTRQPDPLPLD